jgi:hypothetical protein
VPLVLGVLVIAVLLVIAGVLLMHPFVGDDKPIRKPVDPAVTESDNRLTDTMTAAARIFIRSRDMRVITPKALQDAVNGVPGTDGPAAHLKPVRIVRMGDAVPGAVAFAAESKSRIVFVTYHAATWMCLAYDVGSRDTISIGNGPTVASVSNYTKCHQAAEATT